MRHRAAGARPLIPGWVEEVLEAIGLNSVVKFHVLCHLHDHECRLFQPPQLPVWSPARDGAVRESLDDLVARGVLARHRGRSGPHYTYDPHREMREHLVRLFAFLDNAGYRARILRWITGRPRPPSLGQGTS